MSNDIDETAAGGRKNPDNRIVDATDILTGGDALDLVSVDSGDRAKTYLIDLDLIAAAFSGGLTLGQLNFFGNSGDQGTDGRETLDLLKEIEATGDNKRDPDSFVDDGGSRQRLELFETNDAGEAVASDDLLALILAAIEEHADLEFFETETGFDIHIGGRWSTDILRFEGETAQQLAAALLPPDNTPPDAVDDVITITAGETLTDVLALILANDSDPDGDNLTVPFADVVFDPGFFQLAGLSLEGFDGLVTDFEITAFEGVSGTTSFSYSVSDGNGGTDTATVTVEIEAADSDPDLTLDPLGFYGAGLLFGPGGQSLQLGRSNNVFASGDDGRANAVVFDLADVTGTIESATLKIDLSFLGLSTSPSGTVSLFDFEGDTSIFFTTGNFRPVEQSVVDDLLGLEDGTQEIPYTTFDFVDGSDEVIEVELEGAALTDLQSSLGDRFVFGLETDDTQVFNLNPGIPAISLDLHFAEPSATEILLDWEDVGTPSGGPSPGIEFLSGEIYEGFTWIGVPSSAASTSANQFNIQDWERSDGDLEASSNANITWKVTRGGDLFDFISGDLAAGQNVVDPTSAENLTVIGLRDGVEVFSQDLILSQVEMEAIDFNFSDIDELVFRPDDGARGEDYALDNLLFIV